MTKFARRVGIVIGVLSAAAVMTSLVTAAPAQAAASSQVFVVHGIPGQDVDVYVNGAKALPSFKPTTVAGPLELAAGTYDIALTKPGDPVTSAILENKTLAVPGGKNLTLVAHLAADGKPTLTAFVNDTSTIGAGSARLVVRHTAAAPAVDVRAAGKPVFSDLTNPNEAKADIPAGSVPADVVLAGTGTVVIGPTTLNLAAGSETIVYAIGSAQDKTLGLVAQTMTGLGGAPAGMPGGSGGAAATGIPTWGYGLAVAGVLLVVLASVAARRRPRRGSVR